MKLYYYDRCRNKYILIESKLKFSCIEVQNSMHIDMSYYLIKSNVKLLWNIFGMQQHITGFHGIQSYRSGKRWR